MKAYYCDRFVLPLPDGHRFPMDKYRRLRERVARDAPHIVLVEPPAADDDDLCLAHDPGYVSRVATGRLDRREIRELGFPWSLELVQRSRRSVGATVAACRAAVEEGSAVNLAGGTHHAFADRPQGFCVFNDSAVAARRMIRDAMVRRVIIVDCDVHQGNGSASILATDPSVFTFSIHGARNFPLKKEASDLDVAVPDNAGDAVYLELLENGLGRALDRFDAGLAIFLAGADPYKGDRWGKTGLTKAGLAQRDRLVSSFLADAGIPMATTMAGGYAPDIDDIVDIQFESVLVTARHRLPPPSGRAGPAP